MIRLVKPEDRARVLVLMKEFHEASRASFPFRITYANLWFNQISVNRDFLCIVLEREGVNLQRGGRRGIADRLTRPVHEVELGLLHAGQHVQQEQHLAGSNVLVVEDETADVLGEVDDVARARNRRLICRAVDVLHRHVHVDHRARRRRRREGVGDRQHQFRVRVLVGGVVQLRVRAVGQALIGVRAVCQGRSKAHRRSGGRGVLELEGHVSSAVR